MASLADEALELVEYMVKLQYFSHKTGLSIQAKNEPLTRFYLHELEEVIEKLKKVKEYEGHPISALAQQILVLQRDFTPITEVVAYVVSGATDKPHDYAVGGT
jgi:hypothetical protein